MNLEYYLVTCLSVQPSLRFDTKESSNFDLHSSWLLGVASYMADCILHWDDMGWQGSQAEIKFKKMQSRTKSKEFLTKEYQMEALQATQQCIAVGWSSKFTFCIKLVHNKMISIKSVHAKTMFLRFHMLFLLVKVLWVWNRLIYELIQPLTNLKQKT